MTKCLSVVIPCYNEAKTIRTLLEEVLKQPQVLEIILVDDGSLDDSVEIAGRINDQRLKIFKNEINLGKGKTVAKGLERAVGEYVIIQDADLEYDPNEYSQLLKPLLEGKADVVFGSRFLTSTSRRVLYYWHKLGNTFLTTMSNIFTNIDLTDMETCYKVMKNEVAKTLEIQENRFGIEPEITAKLAAMRLRIFEVPISYNGRTYEEGKKITYKDGFSAIRCIIKYNLPGAKKQQLQKWKNAIQNG